MANYTSFTSALNAIIDLLSQLTGGGTVQVTVENTSETAAPVNVVSGTLDSVTVSNTDLDPVPVSVIDGTISITAGDLTIENIAVTSLPGTVQTDIQALGDTIADNKVAVSGPLTDTQLRATAVPVSGPLTDTELRATAVPVSGTVTASGPLTDTELRAADVKVTLDSEAVVLGAGTAAIGKLAANSGVDIGDVDVTSLPALPAGTNSIGSVSIDHFPHANLGAFGDLETTEMTPIYQVSFATGLRDQLITTSVANSATVDANGGRLRLQTGTNSAGSAIAQSIRPVSYRPGQGVTLRFTPFWAGNAASSTQIMGMGNAVDGYFFGYNGTSFGICHRLNSSDTWTAQGSWNGDKCNGTGASGFTLDPTKGVPMMIKYPYLGHGNIRFYILDPATSLWILAHTIKYSNTSATPQLTNPCLSLYCQGLNAGNTSNLISYLTCAAVFIDGPRVYLGPMFGTDNTKNTTTSEAANTTLRSATTVNGVANRGLVRLRQVSVANTGNNWSILRIKKGVTLGGTPAYTPRSGTTADNGVTLTNAQSVVSYDVAGTTVTGGTMLFNAACAPSASYVVDLTPYDIFLAPGETMTFSAESGANSTCVLCINWNEDVQ